MGIRLRAMRDGDMKPADTVLRLAYHNDLDYTSRLRRQLALQPDGWRVMEDGGALVGCGGATVMGAVGYIGLVGVDPARQRQGLATTLMHTLIDWLHTQGCATILLDASDAGKPLYLRLGFTVDDGVSLWRAGATPSLPDSPAEAITVRALRDDDLREVIAFDAQGYGAPRDRVIEAYIRDHPAVALVARDEAGALRGYLAVQAATGAAGPWLASTPDAARALLRVALARDGAAIETVQAPDANYDAATLLQSAGFTPFRMLAHMRLGPPLTPARRQTVYGQISLALG